MPYFRTLEKYPDIGTIPKSIRLLTITGNKRMRSVLIVIDDHENKKHILEFHDKNEESEVIYKTKAHNTSIFETTKQGSIVRPTLFFIEADSWLTHFLSYGAAIIDALRCQSLLWDGALKCPSIRNCYNFLVNTNSDILKLKEIKEGVKYFGRLTINTSIICKPEEFNPPKKYDGVDEDITKEMQIVDSRELIRLRAKQIKIRTTFISNSAVFDFLNKWAAEELPVLDQLSCSIFDLYCIERLQNSIHKSVPGIKPLDKEEAEKNDSKVRMTFRHAGMKENSNCNSYLLKQQKNPKTTALICFHSTK